jgi:zinc protease
MLGSTFWIVATARPGVGLGELATVLQQEINGFSREGPSLRETQRARNQIDVAFLTRMEQLGGMYGKADLLNGYFVRTGNPDYFQEDRARYGAIAPEDLRAIAVKYISHTRRVVLSVVPEGATNLASGSGKEVTGR